MAMKFSEIESLIESGRAMDELNGFFQFAFSMYTGVHSGEMPEYPGMNETLVAMVVLQKLIHTQEGRRVLGIRAPNEVYNAKDYKLGSPQLEIARSLGIDQISREAALDQLRSLFAEAQIYPDPKTLKSLLADLEKEAINLRENLEFMMRSAGWDGSEDGVKEVFDSLRRFGKS